MSAHTQHYLQLYIVQILTTYHLFANDSMASTIMQHIEPAVSYETHIILIIKNILNIKM